MTSPGRIRLLVSAVLSRLMRTAFARRFVLPVFPPLHMLLLRASGGRVNITDLLVPSLVLHSTGAKSGLLRQTPLMCWPRPDGSYLVAGSNWGHAHHPGWTANLLARPTAEIVVRRRRLPVRAELLTGAQRDEVWTVLEAQWPDYRAYERAAAREVRIFRLVPLG